MGQPQVAQLSVEWGGEEAPTTASTDVPTLHDLLPPRIDFQLESYANGRQAPVWMWMPIFAIVRRRGGEV